MSDAIRFLELLIYTRLEIINIMATNKIQTLLGILKIEKGSGISIKVTGAVDQKFLLYIELPRIFPKAFHNPQNSPRESQNALGCIGSFFTKWFPT